MTTIQPISYLQINGDLWEKIHKIDRYCCDDRNKRIYLSRKKLDALGSYLAKHLDRGPAKNAKGKPRRTQGYLITSAGFGTEGLEIEYLKVFKSVLQKRYSEPQSEEKILVVPYLSDQFLDDTLNELLAAVMVQRIEEGGDDS